MTYPGQKEQLCRRQPSKYLFSKLSVFAITQALAQTRALTYQMTEKKS